MLQQPRITIEWGAFRGFLGVFPLPSGDGSPTNAGAMWPRERAEPVRRPVARHGTNLAFADAPMVAFSVSGLIDRSVPLEIWEWLVLGPDRHMVEQADLRVPAFAPARSASRPGGR